MPKRIEVPGQGIVEFPDSMSDADIEKAIKGSFQPQKAQPAVTLGKGLSEEEQFAAENPNLAGLVGVGKGFKQLGLNIPGSAGQFAGNIFQALRHPIQTGKAVGKLGLGGIQKLIPGEQGLEKEFEQAIGSITEPFTSLEKFSETAIEDPFRIASDIAALGTGAGAILRGAGAVGKVGALSKAGQAVGQVSRVLDPVGALGATARKLSSKRRTNSLVKTALSLPKKKGIEKIDDLAEAFLQSDLTVSREALKSLDGKISQLNKAVNDIVDTSTDLGVRIKTGDIVNAIDDLVADANRQGLKMPDLKRLKKLRDDFKAQHGAILTPSQVQEIKVGLNKGFVPDLESRIGQVTKKFDDKIRRQAKLQLEEIHPELKGLNKDLGVSIELREAIEEALIKAEKRQVPVSGLVAGGLAGSIVGAGTGSVGAALGSGVAFAGASILIDRVLKSPNVQIAVARALHKVNIGLAKTGDLSKITRPAFQAGRVEQQPTNNLGTALGNIPTQ